jgi:hypothetical protein
VPRITAKCHDEAFRRHLRRSYGVIIAHTRRRLSYWGRYIIKSIRRDRSLFKYKEGRRRRRGGSGTLAGSLWTKRVQGKTEQVMGWGVPHGEVMEFGPRRLKRWPIVPRGYRSDVAGAGGRSGGGQKLKFLRFKVGGKWRYARWVEHVWTDDQKRPHFGPHMRKHERGFLQDVGSIPYRVLEGKLR